MVRVIFVDIAGLSDGQRSFFVETF